MNGARPVTERQVLTVPFEIAWHDDTPMVAMAEIDSAKINAVFWRTALENDAKRTAIIKLDDVVLDGTEARFVGAIHHITRCGSTALLQQFGALDRTFTLSEPFIFLELLGRSSADQSKAAMRVRKLVGLFSKGFAPVADQIVVKWPTLLCRHALLLNETLSDVPSVLIVRNAVEILASIEAHPLGNMDTVTAELLCGPGEGSALSAELNGLALTATLLAANCRWIAQSAQTYLVNYTQLPDAGAQHVAPVFGVTPTSEQSAKMRQSAGNNAKQPDIAFIADSNVKRRRASSLAQSLAEQVLQPAIDEACAALKSF